MENTSSESPSGQSAQTPYQRRIILINPKFQIRIAIYVGSWLLALSFIYPLVLYSLFDYFIRYAQMDPLGPSVKSLLETRQSVILLMIGTQVAFVGLSFLISLFLAHRIAGPVYRARKHLQAMAEGNLAAVEEIYLRKFDHFRDLADDFNHMLRKVRARELACTSHIQQALAQVTDPQVKQQLEAALLSLRPAPGPESNKTT